MYVSVVGGVFCVTMSLCAFFNNFFLMCACMTVCVRVTYTCVCGLDLRCEMITNGTDL